jgi:hypothetical protein
LKQQRLSDFATRLSGFSTVRSHLGTAASNREETVVPVAESLNLVQSNLATFSSGREDKVLESQRVTFSAARKTSRHHNATISRTARLGPFEMLNPRKILTSCSLHLSSLCPSTLRKNWRTTWVEIFYLGTNSHSGPRRNPHTELSSMLKEA